jgi:hypothetical protein
VESWKVEIAFLIYIDVFLSKFVAMYVNFELINPGCEWDVEDSDESEDEN